MPANVMRIIYNPNINVTIIINRELYIVYLILISNVLKNVDFII